MHEQVIVGGGKVDVVRYYHISSANSDWLVSILQRICTRKEFYSVDILRWFPSYHSACRKKKQFEKVV